MVEFVPSNLEALYPSSSTKLEKAIFNMVSHHSGNSFIFSLQNGTGLSHADYNSLFFLTVLVLRWKQGNLLS